MASDSSGAGALQAGGQRLDTDIGAEVDRDIKIVRGEV